jgi:hypothetical protein
METLRQIAVAVPVDRRDPMNHRCSVYACQNPALAVLEVGGGSGNSNHTSSVRLCWPHAVGMRDCLNRVLGEK